MMFDCGLMADPVVASDGFTYERKSIEDWMEDHDVSPTTSEPLEHKFLISSISIRKMIAAWCEENGVPVPKPPKPAAKPVVAGGGAAAVMLQKPVVMCQRHSKEPLRVFCVNCDHAVCFICACDTGICKTHTTKVFDPLIEELKTDREGWARAQRECNEGAEQLCADIQADGDTKIRVYSQAIITQVADLQQKVRTAAAARSAAMAAIVAKRQEREELVAGASASPEIAAQGSAAAAVVVSALNRAKAPVPPASAAQFRSAAAPAAAVGQVVIADAVVDCEDEAARAAAAAAEAAAAAAAAAATAAAAAAALVAALGPLGGSALLQRVADRNKVQQFAALIGTKLPGKRYRLLYTWSRDGRSNASFQQHCHNQVCALLPSSFLFCLLMLQGRGPR
jgi:hypothetical protein